MSTTVTSWPMSARHAAVVSPTYPAPTTATLPMAARLCQHGFVSRDRCARGLLPAEVPGPLEPRPPPPLALAQDVGHRVAERLGVAVLDHDGGRVHDLGDARVLEGDDRAAACHGLQAGQPEPLVAAREDQASRRRVEVGQLLVDHPAELDGARHTRRGLAPRDSGDEQPQVRMGQARSRPGPEQRVGILTRVQGADEQQVATFDAPLRLDARGGPGLGGEDRVGGLGDDADPLPGGEAHAERVRLRRLGDRDYEVGARKQAAEDAVTQPLAARAGPAPRPGDEVVEGDHEARRAAAWQVEGGGVVDVRADPLDVAAEGDRVLVGRELAVVPAAASSEPVLADREGGGVELDVEEQRQLVVEPRLDQPLQQAASVRPHAPDRARALEWSHVQQYGRATTALPRLVHEYEEA